MLKQLVCKPCGHYDLQQVNNRDKFTVSQMCHLVSSLYKKNLKKKLCVGFT